MELGVLSLSDLQTDPATGRLRDAAARTREIISYGILADQVGLDVFALGEHHSLDFAVSSPAVSLAAIAQATERIRLTSAVSVLSTLDPVRFHEDFASLDLISGGRAEIIAGRSAFVEPFHLFGVDPADYDRVFAEKLDLLLALRDTAKVTWTGQFRSPLQDAQIAPRPVQDKIPIRLGVGGTPASAARAGRLGLPMNLGLIGGDIRNARTLVEHYRRTGEQTEHPASRLRLGVTSHFFVGDTTQAAHDTLYPHYLEYLRPRTPGGRGFHVDRFQFEHLAGPTGALVAGSPQQVIEKILATIEILGANRFLGQIDLGGLPPQLVNRSIELFATQVAPAIREPPTGPVPSGGADPVRPEGCHLAQ